MTYNDIYTKFMIEYDKANVTSSYPSFTKYEVATILNKAYFALIAQKFTGNNVRRSAFEVDIKSIADLQPLVVKQDCPFYLSNHIPSVNAVPFKLPEDYLYFVQLYLDYRIKSSRDTSYLLEPEVYQPGDNRFAPDQNDTVEYTEVYHNSVNSNSVRRSEVYGDASDDKTSSNSSTAGQIVGNPYDKEYLRAVPVKLVSHDIAERFFITPYNMPWIKIPVCYEEDNDVFVVYDTVNPPQVNEGDNAHLTYVKKPKLFINEDNTVNFSTTTEFELSDSMAEELISLAITFALENVESTRLNTKLNTRGLEG